MKQKRLKREDKKLTLFTFAQNIANELELAGRERTKEVYFSAINSFKEFRKGKDITFDMLSNGLMLSYESYFLTLTMGHPNHGMTNSGLINS